MQVTGLDISPGQFPDAVICFSLGNILVIDAVKRKRGRVLWFNTTKNTYSTKFPTLAKWVNSDKFAVVFGDCTMWIFHQESGQEDERLISHFRQKLSEARDEAFTVVNCPSEKNPIEAWKFTMGKVSDLMFCKKIMYVGFGSGQICVFNEHEMVLTFKTYFGGVNCFDIDRDGGILAAGGEDDAISVWSLEDKQLIGRGQEHTNWVSDVTFDPMFPQILYSIGLDCKLVVWKVQYSSVENCNAGRVIDYPARQYIPYIEPITQFGVVSEPLLSIQVKGNLIFIEDSNGIIWLWEEEEPQAKL